MKKFWQRIKKFWYDHKEWLAPLTGLIGIIAGLFGLAFVAKKANDKVEEEEKARIDAIPEKEMYEMYSMSGTTGTAQSTFTDSGMKLNVHVTDPKTFVVSDDLKYKLNNCYISTEGYRLDQLGQFGEDVMNLVDGSKPETRVNLDEVSLKATEKEAEAQQ